MKMFGWDHDTTGPLCVQSIPQYMLNPYNSQDATEYTEDLPLYDGPSDWSKARSAGKRSKRALIHAVKPRMR